MSIYEKSDTSLSYYKWGEKNILLSPSQKDWNGKVTFISFVLKTKALKQMEESKREQYF